MKLMLLIVLAILTLCNAQSFVSVSGREFRLNGEKIFLSGMNIAWHHYGMDFGNGRYDCCTGNTLENYIDRIADNGGSSLRVWIHCVGSNTPAFDNGFVTGTDTQGTMISDLGKFLDKARSRNIAVVLVLWNGATTLPDDNLKNLFWDEGKLQSYIDNALVPMVRALSNKQALASWEIMNEPEGNVKNNEAHLNPCHDTTILANSGAGWGGANIPMYNIQRFVNWQLAAIKENDPKTLVTVGSWNEKPQNDAYSDSFNYYKDECLRTAGGRQNGVMDYYQMHTYSQNGAWQTNAPFRVKGDSYNLDKPLVIGEFSQTGSPADWNDITRQYNYAYYEWYQGAWSWQANGGGHHSDSFDTQARGTRHLQGKNDQTKGGRVNFVFQ